MDSKEQDKDNTKPIMSLDRLVLDVIPLESNYYKGSGFKKFGGYDIDYFKAIKETLYHSPNLTHKLEYKKDKDGKKKLYATSYFLNSKEDGRLLTEIKAGCIFGSYFVKICLNPGKLKSDDYPLIRAELEALIFPPDTLLQFLARCELSYTEYAIDLPHIQHDEIVVICTKAHSSCHKVIEETTEYNAPRGARINIVKYDKQKELFENHGIYIEYPMTRIEARIRESRKSVLDFLEMGEVDFYKGCFRSLCFELQQPLPENEPATTGGPDQPARKGGTNGASLILQNEQEISPKSAYSRLVHALSTLGASPRVTGRLYKHPDTP